MSMNNSTTPELPGVPPVGSMQLLDGEHDASTVPVGQGVENAKALRSAKAAITTTGDSVHETI